jgi:hypothetical protein
MQAPSEQLMQIAPNQERNDAEVAATEEQSPAGFEIDTAYDGPFHEDAFTLAEGDLEDVQEWGEFLIDEEIGREYLGKAWQQVDEIGTEFLLSDEAKASSEAGENGPKEEVDGAADLLIVGNVSRRMLLGLKNNL